MKALLLIVDGMGFRACEEGNAVTPQTMPYFFELARSHDMALLEASGAAVGLAQGQNGNSEVGHLTIGAGAKILSRSEVITESFMNGEWGNSPVWDRFPKNRPLHIVGLLSDAGIHGHSDNLERSARLAAGKGFPAVYVHPVLDGVDGCAGEAPRLLRALQERLAGFPQVHLASVMGRRWAMDRSGNLEITNRFRDHLMGRLPSAPFEPAKLAAHLAVGSEWDFPSHLFSEGAFIKPGDAVLMANHRADRTIQLARSLAEESELFALAPLADAAPAERVFFPERPTTRGLVTELKTRGIGSVRIAEKCKFPHVTFFLNGFHESLGEEAISIPSIPDAAIRSQPAMSLDLLTGAILRTLDRSDVRAVIANVANLDQVGHLGDLELAKQAARLFDDSLRAVAAKCRSRGWNLLLTSDHGNADAMATADGRPNGSHSGSPVPFVFVPAGGGLRLEIKKGSLANVAATLLRALGEKAPKWMEPDLLSENLNQLINRGEKPMTNETDENEKSCCQPKEEPAAAAPKAKPNLSANLLKALKSSCCG